MSNPIEKSISSINIPSLDSSTVESDKKVSIEPGVEIPDVTTVDHHTIHKLEKTAVAAMEPMGEAESVLAGILPTGVKFWEYHIDKANQFDKQFENIKLNLDKDYQQINTLEDQIVGKTNELKQAQLHYEELKSRYQNIQKQSMKQTIDVPQETTQIDVDRDDVYAKTLVDNLKVEIRNVKQEFDMLIVEKYKLENQKLAVLLNLKTHLILGRREVNISLDINHNELEEINKKGPPKEEEKEAFEKVEISLKKEEAKLKDALVSLQKISKKYDFKEFDWEQDLVQLKEFDKNFEVIINLLTDDIEQMQQLNGKIVKNEEQIKKMEAEQLEKKFHAEVDSYSIVSTDIERTSYFEDVKQELELENEEYKNLLEEKNKLEDDKKNQIRILQHHARTGKKDAQIANYKNSQDILTIKDLMNIEKSEKLTKKQQKANGRTTK